MKKFAKLASIVLAAFLSFGVLALTACGGGEDSPESSAPVTESSVAIESSETAEANAYEITVLNADGSAASGVSVQLCIYEDGKLGACLMPQAVGANGKVSYTAEKNTYEIHVLDASYKPLELKDHVVTDAEYGEYTVTLAE